MKFSVAVYDIDSFLALPEKTKLMFSASIYVVQYFTAKTRTAKPREI